MFDICPLLLNNVSTLAAGYFKNVFFLSHEAS